MWKRRQYIFAIKFGQVDFQEAENEKPEFKGTYMRSVLTDEMNMSYFSSTKKKLRLLVSLTISLLIIACVLFSVYGIFTLKSLATCYKTIESVCIAIENNDIVQILLTILNSVQIMIFNTIYSKVVFILNDYENHKFYSSYENSLVLKIFFFTFINTFNSLVIIAFFDNAFPNLNLCKSANGDCYKAISNQMITIFMTFFVMNVVGN